MSVGAVAERYAQAIFELGVETSELSQLVGRLADFSRSYGNSPELQAALADPLLPREQRDQLLSEVARRAQVPELGIRALLVMAGRRRLASLADTVSFLTRMYDQKQGVIRAQVTTARPMPESYYQALIKRLEDATGKKVELEHGVDDSLVAGAVARVGDAVIDASVNGRLAKLERDMLSALSVDEV